jgi:hypothetical protein
LGSISGKQSLGNASTRTPASIVTRSPSSFGYQFLSVLIPPNGSWFSIDASKSNLQLSSQSATNSTPSLSAVCNQLDDGYLHDVCATGFAGIWSNSITKYT